MVRRLGCMAAGRWAMVRSSPDTHNRHPREAVGLRASVGLSRSLEASGSLAPDQPG